MTDADLDLPADAAPGREPHRLRDLDRRGRVLAAVVFVLLLVPVGASVGRALDVGWLPSGDDALIVLRSYDVLGREAPLVGQPSTAETYAPGVAARHPGPAEFYLLALPVRLLGPALGTLLVAAALAGGSVLVAAWVAFRRGGPAVGLGAAVFLGLTMWSSGTAVLSDPISSNVGGYPLLAGAALAWAAWCGDRRLWPLAVAVWSFTIQQHLAIFGAAGMVAAWGVAGAVATTVVHRSEPGRVRAAVRTAGISAGVGVLCWLPPLVDQVAGTGNLGKILRFSSHDERESLGLVPGLRAAGRALASPPLVASRDLTDQGAGGWRLIAELRATQGLGVALGLLALAATAAVALRSWRRDGDEGAGAARLALAATAVVLAVAGAVTTSQIPDSIEAGRINFYRWAWPACLAAWGATTWTLGRWIRRVLTVPALAGAGDAEARRGPRLAPAVVVVAVLVLLVTTVRTAAGDGAGDVRRDEVLFRYDRRAADAVLDAIPRDRPVRLVTLGAASFLSVGPALGVALVDAGLEVRVDTYQRAFWDHRAVDPRPGETVVYVISAPAAVGTGPGRLVAEERLPLEPGGRPEVWGDAAYAVRVVVPPG